MRFKFWILDFGLRLGLFSFDRPIRISSLDEVVLTEQEFKNRTKRLALDVISLTDSLPHRATAQVMGRQLLRCATSIGANYRAACRGKSIADVIAKLAIVEEEADEDLYWMELLTESGLMPDDKASDLKREANEILSMTVASIKTLRSRK
jgi:four helix bundle protein